MVPSGKMWDAFEQNKLLPVPAQSIYLALPSDSRGA